MRYEDARHQIRSGDLLAWRGDPRGVSRIIRCVTGGSWSHVGLAWCFRDRVFVLEAREGRGVGLRALSNALSCDWIPTGASWTDTVEQAAMGRLGLPYSYADAVRVGFGFAALGDGAICSTFAATILALSGLDTSSSYPTPSSLVVDLIDRTGTLVHLN